LDADEMILTVPEAAGRLRLSRAFTYQLVADGELPALRFGRRVLIPRSALERYIEERSSVMPRPQR
jgi:excisionase family DNA binding protein